MSYILGITGGIGAGKSTILNLLKEDYHAYVIEADQVAHRLMEPGGASYEAVVKLLGRKILAKDSSIDKGRMAEKIFGDETLLQRVNEITHPLVIQRIGLEIKEQLALDTPLIVVEAALLSEGALDKWCDSICYVYVPSSIRQERLIASRGYSPLKCRDIMAKQASEEEYRAFSDYVIDNSKDVSFVRAQLHTILKEQGILA